MISKMRAVDYNLLMTILKLFTDRVQAVASEYGITKDIKIEPSYPRDLSSLYKPSIIVRKVDVSQSKIAMGNFIGQIFSDSTYSDVSGLRSDIMLQFDVVTGGNIEMDILATIVMDDILNDIIISHSGSMTLYNFLDDVDNPTILGKAKLLEPCDRTNIPDGVKRPSLDNEYVCAIRQTFSIIQTFIPDQEYVDLSKWMKQSITIVNK